MKIPSSLPSGKFDLEFIELFGLAMKLDISPSIAGDGNCRKFGIDSVNVLDETGLYRHDAWLAIRKVGRSNLSNTRDNGSDGHVQRSAVLKWNIIV
ncbi:MAG: hypothetical protein KF730_05125 [Sphingomonas sp.]|uniref:hypothetical protein n=1 Tax=Sphingomonas sp. TaxID=28214 RepID=UPI0025E1A420|nr:hypothetical protein [Sphingomonas sp.]MBX3563944.1 hypothetical protein [Sphingomonas sp.]